MEFGAHLPLIGFTEKPFSLKELITYTETAGSGFCVPMTIWRSVSSYCV